MASNQKALRIGVYIVGTVQLLDLASVDLFSCMSREYMQDTPMPQAVKDIAIDINITYITATGPSVSNNTTPITAQTAVKIDHSIKDPQVQPGKLDLILIPGPPPDQKFTEEELDFLRKHWNGGNGVTIISVCTGTYVTAAAGICDGKAATGPRGLLSDLKSKHPKVKWEEKRWIRDDGGKLWTSGGVTNGNDAVAAWLREHYPGPLCDVALAMADVGDRGQEYDAGRVSNTMWWMVTLLRAWLKGGKKTKSS